MGHVVIAGASGYLGQALGRHLTAQGRTVRTIGRAWDADARWGRTDEIRAVLDGAAMLVNLAGRSVNTRYDDAHRREILESRTRTTTALREAIATLAAPPPLWCNASTATAYAHTTEAPHTEADATGQHGFSEDVARAWEAALLEGELPGTRRVPLRISIALGDGPATRMLLRLARLGIGGAQHDGWWLPHTRYRGIDEPKDAPRATEPSRGHATAGGQRFSWIHVDDVLGVVDHVEAHPEIDGPVNLAAPGAVTNDELMRTLRETVGMPIGLPAYRWMLEPAMWALRTESELVLKSRWVAPGRLLETGYTFTFPELAPALADIWQRMR